MTLGRGWALVAPWLRSLEKTLVMMAATEPEGLETTTRALAQACAANPSNVRAALAELTALGLLDYRPAKKGGRARIAPVDLDLGAATQLLPALIDRSEQMLLPQGNRNEMLLPQGNRKSTARARPVREAECCSPAATESDSLSGESSTTVLLTKTNNRTRARVERLAIAACGRLPNDEEWALLGELGTLGVTLPLLEATAREVMRQRPGETVGSLHYFRPALLRALGEQFRSEIVADRRHENVDPVSGGSRRGAGAAREAGPGGAADTERWRKWAPEGNKP